MTINEFFSKFKWLLLAAVIIVFVGYNFIFNGAGFFQLATVLLSPKQTIEGKLLTFHADDFQNGRAKRFYTLLTDSGERFELEFKDEGPIYLEKFQPKVKIKGIKNVNKIKVDSSETPDIEIVALYPDIQAGPTTSSSSVVSDFTLVNADTDMDIGPLANGDTLDLNTLPTRNLNIRANTLPPVITSVKFNYNGAITNDRTTPYTLGGDRKGDYSAWTPTVGTHTLGATPYYGKGKTSAGLSLTISFTVKDSGAVPPNSPSGLSATAISSSEISLTWVDNSTNETGFKLESKMGENGTYVQIATLGNNTTAYTNRDLLPSTQYFYRIKAYNSSGDSNYSNEANATTLAVTTPPAAPTNLSAATISSTQINLSWTDNSSIEDGFKIERKQGAGGVYSEIAVVGINVRNYSDTGLVAATQYFYRVRAYNSIGDSNYSNEANATTLPVGRHPLSDIPQLHSNSGVPAKVYLDFDGEPAFSWYGWPVPITPAFDQDGDVNSFTDAELNAIYEMWLRVSEKYSPFNIDVTTVIPDVTDKVLKVIVGGSGAWTGGTYGGVAYVGVFPGIVFVFENNLASNAKYVAEASAHESGHGFGLEHQSLYDANGNKIKEYNPGNSLRAPIMGNSYSSARGLWWYGASLCSTCYQDDLLILNSSNNGFYYRADDISNTFTGASPLSVLGNNISGSGLIEQISDNDMFSFSTDVNATVTLRGNVFQYPMFDLKMNVYYSNGTLVDSADTSTLGETLILGLPAGFYYVEILSHGSYGDIGQYTISGTIVP